MEHTHLIPSKAFFRKRLTGYEGTRDRMSKEEAGLRQYKFTSADGALASAGTFKPISY